MQEQYFSVTIISSRAHKLGARADFEGFEERFHLEVPTNWWMSSSVIHIFKNKQIKNPNKYEKYRRAMCLKNEPITECCLIGR